jgi:HPt (histidine-containing phosphotransfer) domain-containing protein
MYHRLLARFCENQADAADRLRADQASGDIDAMVLRAHTLRGLAGNIGAADLARIAGELEESLKQGMAANDPAVEGQLARLQDYLPTVLALAGQLAAETPDSPSQPIDDLSGQALSDLHRLLDNDDASAVRYFEGISSRLRQVFDPQLVDQLARQINQYDFDDAKETLEQLTLKRQHT